LYWSEVDTHFAQLVIHPPGTLTNADHLPLPAGGGSDGSLHSESVPRNATLT
jgi:hypothetical protein